jgi:alpha-tubulin suppressor-like RCC1 family protein
MSTGFKVTQIGNYIVDLDDILLRREKFSDKTLCTWGTNDNGQLGDNDQYIHKSSPITVIGSNLTVWKKISSGDQHAGAIKLDGTLWMWGYNSSGGLGDNSIVDRASPITLTGLWKDVSCGALTTAAIKSDGTLWTWGNCAYGMLGNSDTVNRSNPVTTSGGGTDWKIVDFGNFSCAAIKTDGTLWLWGDNRAGQLGIGTTISKASPVTVSGGGTNWNQISVGTSHVAAIKTDGTLWTWGDNIFGELGNNTTINTSSPNTVSGGSTNWKEVSCAGEYGVTIAVKTDGTLWTWGYGAQGQLGNNSVQSISSPSTIAGGGTNWKTVSNRHKSFAAIKTDGTLWTCGYNFDGMLGISNPFNDNISSPRTVAGGGNTWSQVSVGYTFMAAIRE